MPKRERAPGKWVLLACREALQKHPLMQSSRRVKKAYGPMSLFLVPAASHKAWLSSWRTEM